MSDEGCVNECTVALRFPRRPGTNPPKAHDENCFCCTTDELISKDNRPSLSRFNYRLGTYGSICEFLFDRLNQTPELQKWTHRAPDDPAVALIQGAAILGDILTFYQEIYANEAYLGTAEWRESIASLVRLVGYRLSPAVGGKAVFAFELTKDEPVKVPAGFPLMADLEELPKPAEFETTEEITAYPWLSRFSLYKELQDGDIDPATTTEFYISEPDQLTKPLELKVGDRLMLGESDETLLGTWGGTLAGAETVTIESVREQHGQKYFTIKGKLKRPFSVGCLRAFRLGRTFHHFGHNSPLTIVDSNAPVTSTATVTPASGSPTTTTTTSKIPFLPVPMTRSVDSMSWGPSVIPSLNPTNFPIDAEVKDLATGVPIIIQSGYTRPRPFFVVKLLGELWALDTTVRMINDVQSVNLRWGGVSGTVSMIKLNANLSASVGSNATMHIDTTLIHEVTSPLFTIKRAKQQTTAQGGHTLYFYGTKEQALNLKHRRIMLERSVKKPGEQPRIVSVNAVTASPPAGTARFPQLYRVTLSDTVQYAEFDNDKPEFTVFGNLANADEGRTQPEVAIGSGDATAAFQNFKLPKSPLTYHIVPENTPSETPEIWIYVDGRQWNQVDSFFGRGKDEQIYVVREDTEGNSWVQFGDNKTGAALTTGFNNVTAVFRVGDGAYGPLRQDAKVQASAKLRNLDKIEMPMKAAGGADAEDGNNARRAAPGKVQSLGRIVSLRDFEAEAIAISGVASAAAAWQLVDNAPAVVVTVLMETGRGTEIADVRDTLRAYNSQRGSARHSIIVIHGKRMHAAVRVEFALKPSYRADIVGPNIRRALGANYGQATRYEDQAGLFSLRKRRFGGREYASNIEGWTQNVEGVLWARTLQFQQLSDNDDPETILLPTSSELHAIVACDAGHILSLYDKHLVVAQVMEDA